MGQVVAKKIEWRNTMQLPTWVKRTIKKCMPDKAFVKMMYKLTTNEKLDLKNPVTFNEKISWLKLYDKNPLYTKLADKYEVRKYVADIIGEQHLIPLIGVWDTFDEIDFESFPDRFVLKCTHDSASVIICKDKKEFDFASAKASITNALKWNYFYEGREWPYKNIVPRVIAEHYIEDSNKQLWDYKFFCFNGEVKLIQVDCDRFTGHKRNLYTLDWTMLPVEYNYPNTPYEIAKPSNLESMMEIASKLSHNLRFVRMDLYSKDEEILFGEFTFYPDGGRCRFTPNNLNFEMGAWLEIPI